MFRSTIVCRILQIAGERRINFSSSGSNRSEKSIHREGFLFGRYFEIQQSKCARDDSTTEMSSLLFVFRFFFFSFYTRFTVHQDLTVDFEHPSICDEMYKIVLKLVILMKKIDDNDCDRLPYFPTILIFLPGINEINTLYDVLMEYNKP